MTLEEFKKVKIEAMKARDSFAVSAYNAIISKLMLLKTEKAGVELTEQDSINVVKKVEKETPIVVEKQKQQYIGLIIPQGKEDDLEELYDILSFYPGDVKVVVKINGKNQTLKYTVRNCRGLISEICSIIPEENIKFFEV